MNHLQKLILLSSVLASFTVIGCGNDSDNSLVPAGDPSVYEAEEARLNAEAEATGVSGGV
ncbi:hypothetical protein [Rhodopirellula europaea]|jgi:hypothetical protein|uniref:hypothetical protein n=1 Tax=Rhodopirellula europaea TaxID=1263866 RepID=UPI00056664DD|nr:hypothetical protein [Rhodopirellula europaea]